MAFHNLHPCPFCGGKPYIENETRCFINGQTAKAALVRCTDCNCRTARIPISIGRKQAVESAIMRWNSRYEDRGYFAVGDHMK